MIESYQPGAANYFLAQGVLKENALNMSTHPNPFESYYTAVRARLQYEDDQFDPPRKREPEYEIREYFATLYRFAPSIARQPLVAASWLRNALQTQYVGPSDVAALCRTELDYQRVHKSARRRSRKAWDILMQDPNQPDARVQAKDDPEEARRRNHARSAVLAWLEHRPELAGVV